MKQFVPVCDEDWSDAMSAGLVPVPYQPGVRCFHALREAVAESEPHRAPLAPTAVEAIRAVSSAR